MYYFFILSAQETPVSGFSAEGRDVCFMKASKIHPYLGAMSNRTLIAAIFKLLDDCAKKGAEFFGTLAVRAARSKMV